MEFRKHRAHDDFSPCPERGMYLIREPHGIPDVLMFAEQAKQEILLHTAAILSVQGITARIAIVHDAEAFRAQNTDYQQTIFSDLPSVRIAILDEQSVKRITNRQVCCIGFDESASQIARKAVLLLQTTKQA